MSFNKNYIYTEFRNSSCYEKETTEILKEYNAIIVLQDKPAAATEIKFGGNPQFYIRLHGPNVNYKGGYEEEFLRQLAKKITQ